MNNISHGTEAIILVLVCVYWRIANRPSPYCHLTRGMLLGAGSILMKSSRGLIPELGTICVYTDRINWFRGRVFSETFPGPQCKSTLNGRHTGCLSSAGKHCTNINIDQITLSHVASYPFLQPCCSEHF